MSDRPKSLRAYWISAALLNALLIAAGVVYQSLEGIPAATAAPIVAAFLLQATVYLAPGFREVRRRLEGALSPARLAAGLTAASLLPYLIYSLPLGLFQWTSLGKLAALVLTAAFLFVLVPPKREGLAWQDVVVMALIAYPLVSGLSPLLREIYPSPGRPVPRLDAMGKLMVIALGATAFLSLRRVRGAGFSFRIRRRDLRIGFKHYLRLLPFALAVALASGFISWGPTPIEGWRYFAGTGGKLVGIYLATALPEELFFRGLLQNLLQKGGARPRAAQAAASLAFGAAHLGFRSFPNWPFAATAAAAGWFYGDAYREGKSVVASAVTHTLTVMTWTLLFR